MALSAALPSQIGKTILVYASNTKLVLRVRENVKEGWLNYFRKEFL